MRQLLSILLSFSIVFCSISPSYAQLGRLIQNSMSASEHAGLAARNAGRISKIAANHEITLNPWKYINFSALPTGYVFAYAGKPLSQVVKQYPINLDLSRQVGKSTGNQPLTQDLIQQNLSAAVGASTAQILKQQNLFLESLDSSVLGNLSQSQITELFSFVFDKNTPALLKEKFFLQFIPQFIVARDASIKVPEHLELVRFYRSLLSDTTYPTRPLRISQYNETLLTWAKKMTAISNLGLLGIKTDVELILKTAKSAPESLGNYTDVIAGRALLALGADEAVKELAAFRLQTTKAEALTSPFWAGVSTSFETHGSTLGTPIASTTGHTPDPVIEQVLVNASELNALHLDMDWDTTRDWVAQRGLVKTYQQSSSTSLTHAPSAEGMAVSPSATNLDVPLSGSQLESIHLPPTESTIPESAVSMAAAPRVVPETAPAANKTVPSPQKTSSVFSRYASKLLPSFLNFSAQSANRSAELVLNKPRPLITQLRDILFSEASKDLKKKALMRLYENDIFQNVIANLPANVRTPIEQATTGATLENALWKLYDAHFFDTTLESIADVSEQGSLLAELQGIVSQADWGAKAARAYEEEAVLPFTGEDNFSGVVPTVPVADQKSIVATFRPEGFAVENKMTHVDTSSGSYYQNNIPFYYRNAKGELSSWPVGILSQEPANWYGRLLSTLRLATQPGMTIPKGFVLALDEQGQWKLIMPKGNLSVVESDPISSRILKQIQKDGSVRVTVDSPYSTTDLLAMAHMLEHNPQLNLELKLNTPHSLKPFLKAHALFVGNDAGASLTGPFKSSLKEIKGLSNTLANFVSGFGYVSPIAGGYAMPLMSRMGNVKTTQLIYLMSGAALAFSWFGLGMNGFVDPATIPLLGLAIPTVALVLGASLANSFVPTFLNFYKDPTARTAANLDFATNKQMSRLMLTGLTAVGAAVGMNWTAVVPIGLGLLGVSYALFRNTPMYREATTAKLLAKEKAAKEAAEFAALSPEEQAAKLAEQQALAEKLAQDNKQFVTEYQDFRNNLQEMRDIRSRVKMVYASYAASLMMLGQAANEVLGSGIGQGFITGCMAATYLTRKISTSLVKKNKVTDDQLTGISLPLLATTGAALALAPYSGALALGTGLAGVLHYMATAVPGQLDAARMQNIVTAEMRARKQKIEEDASLTRAEKDAQIQRLKAEEQVWSAQASKDYSLYNSRGLWGIGAATAGAFLFADYGPQWTKDMLEWVSNILDAPTPSLALNRLLFGYSATIASILAWKNRALTADFFNLFGDRQVTAEKIAANKIHAKTFGINEKNASLRLVDSQKQIKELATQLVDYGRTSEQKMTTMLNKLTSVYNRLVAESEILGMEAVNPTFDELRRVLHSYETILNNQHNDLSIMLQRQYAALKNHLYDGAGNSIQTPSYIEEGTYQLPKEYDAYESARWLVSELDQLAFTLLHKNPIDTNAFVTYLNRAREDLLRYEKANPADAARTAQLRRHMDSICSALQKRADELLVPTGHETPEEMRDLQRLRDVLAAYAD